MNNETIYISIAACKEEFLVQTIKSALANADNPDLLYFGIANMVIDQKDFLSDPIFNHPRLTYVDIKHERPLGTGIGRMMASIINYRDHEYLLQVDAHNVFEKGWDTTLKQHYNDLLKICDKPIISTNPLRWIDGPNKEVFLHNNLRGIAVDPFDFKTDENFGSLKIQVISINASSYANAQVPSEEMMDYAFIEGCHVDWQEGQDFVEHGLIFASFMFTKFGFTRELMHDPANPFNGDQINLSFRAGTRGYRMFSIKKCIMWSKDKFNDGKLLSDNDWRTLDRGKIGKFNEVNSQFDQTEIFSGEYLGYWGAPNKESIAEYYNKIGIDLSKYFISKREYLVGKGEGGGTNG